MTEIAMEVQTKKLNITRCHNYMEKGENKVESCTPDLVAKEFKIPTVRRGVEDIIELSFPQAQQQCRVFKFDIPETICKVI